LITDKKFSVLNLALGVRVGAGNPQGLPEMQYNRQYQEKWPVRVWIRGI
jgi:hypothetical protein